MSLSVTGVVSGVMSGGVGNSRGITRRVPPGLPRLPLTLVSVNGIGQGRVVTSPHSAVDGAIALNRATYNSTACTFGTGGVDSTASGNTFFATPQFAVNTWTGGSECLAVSDGTYGGIDFRNTNASQGGGALMKVVRGMGYNVLLCTSGPALSSLTFTADATFTDCWGTPGAFISGSQTVTRTVLDSTLDAAGHSLQAKQYSTLAALAAATEALAQYYDNAAKRLFVKTTPPVNVNTIKANLRAMYTDAAGDSRVITYGAKLCLDGIQMQGMQFVQIDALSAGTTRQMIALNNVVQLWATAKGADLTQAGDFYATNWTNYASAQDGINGFAPSPITGQGLILVANSTITKPGDLSVFALDNSLQCISAHGGTSAIGWGNTLTGANGQTISDNAINGFDDVSWYVGNIIGLQGTSTSTVENMLFGAAAAPVTGSRTAFIDTNTLLANTAEDMWIANDATVYGYHTTVSTFDPSGSSTITPYSPGSPP